MIKWRAKWYHCSVEVSMDLLNGKWKCLMLWRLNEGTRCYKEITRILPGLSPPEHIESLVNQLTKINWYSANLFRKRYPKVKLKPRMMKAQDDRIICT
ncbi:winged helix-turn-helix transcriptional regulator [Desulfosediminicola flagellatus]|uniref:winged helix-turn-helix transcriptional regulator n=1 Tax=Desulfosediminicola flagellatus TaxID=2569541 RepID=UPI0010AB64DA